MPLLRRNYSASEKRAVVPNLALVANQLRRKDPVLAGALDEVQRSFADLATVLSAHLEFFDRIDVLGSDGELAGWIGSDQDIGIVAGAWFRNLYIGGTGPADAPIVADATGNVSIDGDVLVSGSVSASKFVTLTPMLEGLTLTNNSPGAGRIAWSACTVTYNGTTYSISSGNTSTAELYVLWTVGNSTFTASTTYTPAANVFLIATNNSGTADTGFNKVPMQGIQRDNLSFSLITGLQLQPISTTSVLFTSTGTTSILNESVAGGLLSIYIEVTAAMAAAVTATLEFSTDGASATSIPLYTAATTFAPELNAITPHITGTGANVSDSVLIQLQIGYSASCSVSVVVTGSAAGQSVACKVFFGRAT